FRKSIHTRKLGFALNEFADCPSIMANFTRRRIRNFGLTAMTVAVVGMWRGAQERGLGPSGCFTGRLLLGTVLFLALYNARKKFPFLPLGTSATWLQWHIYAGLGSVGLFALHAGIPWPAGLLNSALAGFYLATVASGIIGLYLTRSIPQQLS